MYLGVRSGGQRFGLGELRVGTRGKRDPATTPLPIQPQIPRYTSQSLFQPLGPAGAKQVGDGPADRRDRNPFLDGHVLRCEVLAMEDHALRLLSPQPGGLRNREVNGARVCVGDSVDNKSRCPRQSDVARPSVRPRPKDRLPILREPARREMRETKDTSGGSLDPLTLCKPRQHRVGVNMVPLRNYVDTRLLEPWR